MEQETKSSQVWKELKRLDEQIEVLSNSCLQLQSKLQNYLKPRPPYSGVSGWSKLPASGSPLLDEIRAKITVIQSISIAMNDINERVEL